MDRFEKRLGSLIEEGELLTTLSDNSKMWVYFNVPEAEYLDYIQKAKKEPAPKVLLQMANKAMFDVPGVVETIEADFNNETGSFDQAGIASRKACGRITYQIVFHFDRPMERPAIIWPSPIARMEPRRYSAW